MSGTQSLDDIFDGEAPAALEKVPETVTEPVAPGPTGDKELEAAPPAAEPQERTETNEPPHVPRKALEDERRKRQDLERQISALQAQIAPPKPSSPQHPQGQPPQQPQAQDIPDPVLEPERYVRWQQMQMATQLYANNVRVSQRMMRQQHQDYDEIEAIFAEEAHKDPSLARQLFQSDFPAEFAYQAGKKLKLMRELGDNPEAYIEAKIAERMSQQGQTPAPKAPLAKPAVPKSLAGVTSAQPRHSDGRYAAPPSLSDILD